MINAWEVSDIDCSSQSRNTGSIRTGRDWKSGIFNAEQENAT